VVAVVGDGAVGLCGVIAARRLGAEQIIMLGRHADRIALAREFGATEIVSDRGAAAIERVRELTGGLGAHSVLECVGHGEAMRTAVSIARAGGAVGRVGVPQETRIPNAQPTFFSINTISPGIIITPLANDELRGPRGAGYRRMIELSAAGRAGTPDEVGTVGALLMGPDGAFITGSDFLMDGGVTASYWFGDLAAR
jgi:threonine dehydrogenase-like Zn-dependent dehydrogenase